MSLIQSASNSTSGSTASSIAATLSGATTAGSLLVVCVAQQFNGTGNISSIAHNSDSFTLAVEKLNNTASQEELVSIYYSYFIAGTSPTVTVNFSTAVNANIVISEWSGFGLSNPLDTTGSSSGTGLTAQSGSCTATNALVIAAMGHSFPDVAGTYGTPTSSYTQIAQTKDTTRTALIAAYNGSVTGSTSTTATISAGTIMDAWSGCIASFVSSPTTYNETMDAGIALGTETSPLASYNRTMDAGIAFGAEMPPSREYRIPVDKFVVRFKSQGFTEGKGAVCDACGCFCPSHSLVFVDGFPYCKDHAPKESDK